MAIVFILPSLEAEISKRFKKESIEIFSLMLSLEENPQKGKEIGRIGNVAIKELKYKKFRFYFVTDNYKIKFLKAENLKDLIIKFVRMSEKKDQQKTIDEIKHLLRNLGDENFSTLEEAREWTRLRTESGTTGVVAKQLGRKYIGIDMSKEYLELTKKRIQF